MIKILGSWFKTQRQPIETLGIEFKPWMSRADMGCLYRAIFCGATDKEIMIALRKISRGIKDNHAIVNATNTDNIEVNYTELVNGVANGSIEPFGENINAVELNREFTKLNRAENADIEHKISDTNHKGKVQVKTKGNATVKPQAVVKVDNFRPHTKEETKKELNDALIKLNEQTKATEIKVSDISYTVLGVKGTAKIILHALGFKDDFINACHNEFTALGLKQVVTRELCYKTKLSDEELSQKLSNLVKAYSNHEKFEGEWLEREAFRAELLENY